MSDLYMSYKVMENNEGQAVQTIPSYEVAKMMEKEHKEIMWMIDGYEKRHITGIKPTLESAQVNLQDYFIETVYKNSQNKEFRCYECTKLGCDMLANKMTGEKGILFTAKYVKKFNAMQNEIKEQQLQLPSTYKEALQQLLAQVEENEKLEQKLEKNSKMINQIAASKNSLLVREVAKVLSNEHSIKIGEKQLYKKLREWGWVFQNTTEAKQEAIRRGYLEVREGVRESIKGVFTFHTTRVTGKGQRKILEKLLEELEEMECATNE